MNISIIWAGAFWYTLARHLWNNNSKTTINLYEKNEETTKYIQTNREHPIFFKWHKIPENINISNDISAWLKSTDILFIAIPVQFIQDFFTTNIDNFKDWITIINCAKWIDNINIKTVSQIIKNTLKDRQYNYGMISGWMIASDFINWDKIWADLAINHWGLWKQIVDLIQNDQLDINLIEENIINIELNSALKNILAIRTWYWQSQNISYSSLWYYVTHMSQEFKKIIKIFWWEQKFDLWEYSCGWDVITTCFWPSRNREFGKLLWKWNSIDQIIDTMQKENRHAEWYYTLKAIYKIIKNEEWFENIKKLHNLCK